VKIVTSRRNPIVGAFRELAGRPASDGSRLLLDGVHLIREATQAGLPFEILAVARRRLDADTPERAMARDLEARGVEVVAADERVLAACSPLETSAGTLAIIRRPVVSPAEICAARCALVVAVVDVQDPGNVGSLIRAAEAGGATGVLVCAGSANPFAWKAVRGSMGSVLRLPVAAGLTAAAAVDCMTRAGLRVVAAVPRHGVDPDAVDWRGPVGILLGGEGAGLSDDFVARADARVSIPMAAPVESLNVASAGAILVYAARRQRALGSAVTT
jgi:TrmH family RNA methyltransferase